MTMTREETFLALNGDFDILIIGGGATGLGIAVDASSRGFRTALVEAGDFAQATSSRATKLVHGGVRYLASGQLHLVYEALHERAVLWRNAPHLVHPQAFVMPTYTWHELPFYGSGLLLYNLMSGKSSLGPTKILGAKSTIQHVPNIAPQNLTGSVLYHDGQFNDARLALTLARTATDLGAIVLNYARCIRLIDTNGKLTSAIIADAETGKEYTVRAKLIVNATGIFTDELRTLDDPATPPLLTVSRGTHIIVGSEFLGATSAIMVPKTRDGRVIFAIPWQGKTLIGTTDIPAPTPQIEPGHTPNEIDFLIETIAPYLAKPIQRSDVLSVFSGLRPLVTGKGASTSKISREHHIEASRHGLVTIAGGKWTTYRRMAEDTLDFAAHKGLIENRLCITDTLKLHGAATNPQITDPYLREYGADIEAIESLIANNPNLATRIDPTLPYTFAQVVYAIRCELARSVDDILSRRTRALLLDSAATLRAAPAVAALTAQELGHDQTWVNDQLASFTKLVHADYTL
jgi:glycerol-3-phosphate dehydrogenase